MANPYCSAAQLYSMFDQRTMLQLSGDQNSGQGVIGNVQFLLDMQAAELDTYLNGRVALPISFPAIAATGQIAIVTVPTDNSTITIGDGKTTQTFTFLSGGVATNQVDTSSGILATIAGILSDVISESVLNVTTGENGNVSSLVNNTTGIVGNVQMTTTAPTAVSLIGMSGGATFCPLVLTKWVGVTAARRLFARRADMPDAIKADSEWADNWMKLFITTLATIPGADILTLPVLQDSNHPQGSSSFDYVFGTNPSPFGPTNPSGNIAQVGPGIAP